jgi:cellulose synthase/poly-beta-1,6-N-acetylglucosamine synthase-like glycosyltransferase/peptidoglycan/xylan/chitin deacetylase (PgdA/CDA1 family)
LLAVGLALSGYASHRTGPSATPSGRAAEPGLPRDAGPILDLSGGALRSISPPPGTVVLTFDDGPDPRWTPEVLDVLAAEDVPATFFVLGSRVGENPDLARRIHREGHELGVHTFSHRDVTTARPWQRDLELSLSQAGLAGTVGIRSSLFRPPYSSTPELVSRQGLRALRAVADDGYLVVLSTVDSRDWERPGVDRIVDAATPPPGQGGVVLLHDGGGDRSQTVAALRTLVTDLKAQGFRFATVGDVVAEARGGRRSVATEQPVGTGRRTAATALVSLQRTSSWVAAGIEALFVPIGVLALARAVMAVVLARRHARRRRARPPSDPRTLPPPVSIVVPAYNEEIGIAAAVTSLARSDHPAVEVVVVDDGSTDRTAETVAGLGLPNVTVVRQANTGKPGALNTGVARASHELIITVDGDTVFQPDTVGHLIEPFADAAVGAVSGNTKVANRGGLLGRWQHIEYVMGFNLDRRMYEQLDCMPTVPGAIGAFRRTALTAVGGVSDDTLAEDTDLTMAINRAGWRVVYEEDAVAWTEAPATLGGLWRQRYRWSFGTMQAMWKHRRAVFDRAHPGVGRRALPYLLLFQVLLPLLAPLVDLWALYGLVFLDPARVAVSWMVFTALQTSTAIYAFRLDRERLRPLWTLPVQQVVYRQLMYLVVIQSVVTAVLGVRLPWQRIERTGAINPVG